MSVIERTSSRSRPCTASIAHRQPHKHPLSDEHIAQSDHLHVGNDASTLNFRVDPREFPAFLFAAFLDLDAGIFAQGRSVALRDSQPKKETPATDHRHHLARQHHSANGHGNI